MFHKLLWYSLAALCGAIVWWALWIECVPAKTKWLSVTIHDHNMRINLFNSPHPLPCHSTPGDHRVILAVILSPLLAGHECNERGRVYNKPPRNELWASLCDIGWHEYIFCSSVCLRSRNEQKWRGRSSRTTLQLLLLHCWLNCEFCGDSIFYISSPWITAHAQKNNYYVNLVVLWQEGGN